MLLFRSLIVVRLFDDSDIIVKASVKIVRSSFRPGQGTHDDRNLALHCISIPDRTNLRVNIGNKVDSDLR